MTPLGHFHENGHDHLCRHGGLYELKGTKKLQLQIKEIPIQITCSYTDMTRDRQMGGGGMDSVRGPPPPPHWRRAKRAAIFRVFYDSKRGVYNFGLTPTPAPQPQPQTHRVSAYRALAHLPLPSLAYEVRFANRGWGYHPLPPGEGRKIYENG